MLGNMSTAQLEVPSAADGVLSDYEIERGKPMPSKNHGIIQTRLGTALSRSEQYEAASEMTIDIGTGSPLTPDLAVILREPMDVWNDEIRSKTPPITTVEIVSFSQSSAEMTKKVRSYLQHGVKSCWLVDPPMQQITIFTADGKKKTYEEGVVTDPVTGLTADLAVVFA